jgi:hypothetical protein
VLNGYLARMASARDALRLLFGAKAKVVVGVVFVALTVFQAWLWGIQETPSAKAIFWLSIEALFFASYAVIATGLGYRATERVEAHVEEAVSIESDSTHVKREEALVSADLSS